MSGGNNIIQPAPPPVGGGEEAENIQRLLDQMQQGGVRGGQARPNPKNIDTNVRILGLVNVSSKTKNIAMFTILAIGALFILAGAGGGMYFGISMYGWLPIVFLGAVLAIVGAMIHFSAKEEAVNGSVVSRTSILDTNPHSRFKPAPEKEVSWFRRKTGLTYSPPWKSAYSADPREILKQEEYEMQCARIELQQQGKGIIYLDLASGEGQKEVPPSDIPNENALPKYGMRRKIPKIIDGVTQRDRNGEVIKKVVIDYAPIKLAAKIPPEHLKSLPSEVQNQINDEEEVEIYFMVYDDSKITQEEKKRGTYADKNQPRHMFYQGAFSGSLSPGNPINQEGITKTSFTKDCKMGLFATTGVNDLKEKNLENSNHRIGINELKTQKLEIIQHQREEEISYKLPSQEAARLSVDADSPISSFYSVAKVDGKAVVTYSIAVHKKQLKSEERERTLKITEAEKESRKKGSDILGAISKEGQNVVSLFEDLKEKLPEEVSKEVGSLLSLNPSKSPNSYPFEERDPQSSFKAVSRPLISHLPAWKSAYRVEEKIPFVEDSQNKYEKSVINKGFKDTDGVKTVNLAGEHEQEVAMDQVPELAFVGRENAIHRMVNNKKLVANVPITHRENLPKSVKDQIEGLENIKMQFVVYTDHALTENTPQNLKWQPRLLSYHATGLADTSTSREKTNDAGETETVYETYCKMGVFSSTGLGALRHGDQAMGERDHPKRIGINQLKTQKITHKKTENAHQVEEDPKIKLGDDARFTIDGDAPFSSFYSVARNRTEGIVTYALIVHEGDDGSLGKEILNAVDTSDNLYDFYEKLKSSENEMPQEVVLQIGSLLSLDPTPAKVEADQDSFKSANASHPLWHKIVGSQTPSWKSAKEDESCQRLHADQCKKLEFQKERNKAIYVDMTDFENPRTLKDLECEELNMSAIPQIGGKEIINGEGKKDREFVPIELIVSVPEEHRQQLPVTVQKQIPAENDLEMYFVIYNDSQTTQDAEGIRWQQRNLIAQPWLFNEINANEGKENAWENKVRMVESEMGIYSSTGIGRLKQGEDKDPDRIGINKLKPQTVALMEKKEEVEEGEEEELTYTIPSENFSRFTIDATAPVSSFYSIVNSEGKTVVTYSLIVHDDSSGVGEKILDALKPQEEKVPNLHSFFEELNESGLSPEVIYQVGNFLSLNPANSEETEVEEVNFEDSTDEELSDVDTMNDEELSDVDSTNDEKSNDVNSTDDDELSDNGWIKDKTVEIVAVPVDGSEEESDIDTSGTDADTFEIEND